MREIRRGFFIAMEEKVTIGQLMRPHGLGGQIKCKPLTHDIKRCEKLTRVFAVKDGNETDLSMEKASVAGGFWLLKFKGYDTVEAVSPFVNADLCVPLSERIPAPAGEYYASDFEGFDAIGESGTVIGKISSVQTLPSVNVFVLNYRGREVFAPWIDACVGAIDMEKKTVRISETFLDNLIDGGRA